MLLLEGSVKLRHIHQIERTACKQETSSCKLFVGHFFVRLLASLTPQIDVGKTCINKEGKNGWGSAWLTRHDSLQLLWRNRAHQATVGSLLRGMSGVLSSASLSGTPHRNSNGLAQNPTSHWDRGLPPIKTRPSGSSDL